MLKEGAGNKKTVACPLHNDILYLLGFRNLAGLKSEVLNVWSITFVIF